MTCEGNCTCTPDHIDAPISPTNSYSESDAVWADDDDYNNANENELSNATNDIQRSHYSRGFLDGITNAKENSLQVGFDTAFPKGAQLGIRVGKILSTVLSIDTKEEFDKAKSELNIIKVLDKKYFNEDGDNLEISNQHHPVIDKWEKYINN